VIRDADRILEFGSWRLRRKMGAYVLQPFPVLAYFGDLNNGGNFCNK